MLFDDRLSISQKNWRVTSALSDADRHDYADLGLADFLITILRRQNIPAENIQDFFEPRLKNSLPDPFTFYDMEKAVNRIGQAIKAKQTIAIYSDYDVDGACSAALWLRYLNYFDVPNMLFIPNRIHDGYGIKQDRLDELQQQGAELIICADSGTGFELKADFASDVIVFDHHQAIDFQHQFFAFINPTQSMDESIEGSQAQKLCAAAICYLALIALNRLLRPDHEKLPDLKEDLDLVALATVADVMPLTGLNRTFVAQGLKILNQQKNLGIAALNQLARQNKTFKSSQDISFGIAPYLNAGGRMGESLFATQLLIADTEFEAQEYAERLQKLNKLRIETQSHSLQQIEKNLGTPDAEEKFILAGAHDLHIGVTGIVAGRLKDKYQAPSLVVSYDADDYGTGSARSIQGVDIADILSKACQAKILLKSGGHKMAGGFALMRTAEQDFRRFLNEHMPEKSDEQREQMRLLEIDAMCDIPKLTGQQIYWLEQLAPFGAGHQEPIFGLQNLRLQYYQLVGKNNKHLQMNCANQSGEILRMIMFSARDAVVKMAKYCHESGALLHVAGHLQINEYQGSKNIQLLLLDMMLADEEYA